MNGTNLYTTDVNAQTGFRPATIEEIMTGARQVLSNRVRKGTALTSPQLTRDFLTLKLGALEHEVFALILLDGRRADELDHASCSEVGLNRRLRAAFQERSSESSAFR